MLAYLEGAVVEHLDGHRARPERGQARCFQEALQRTHP